MGRKKSKPVGRRPPRAHRERKRHLRLHSVQYGRMPGPGVVSASLAEMDAALRTISPEVPWTEAADLVLPIMPRVRPYPDGVPTPLQTIVPPGIFIGLGIHVGPAFLAVNESLVELWGVAVSDVSARAIANVHDRAASIDPAVLVRESIGGVPAEALQTGVSIGSTLILAPSHLRRIFGSSSRLFLTPIRDLLIALPGDVDRGFALWLHHEFADLDPNCLRTTAFRFDGERVHPEELDALITFAAPGSTPARPFYVS